MKISSFRLLQTIQKIKEKKCKISILIDQGFPLMSEEILKESQELDSLIYDYYINYNDNMILNFDDKAV